MALWDAGAAAAGEFDRGGEADRLELKRKEKKAA